MKNNQEIECALESCQKRFVKAVHNQRFCSKECCKIYTNRRILAQYHAKKNKKDEARRCAHKGCITILSRYNDDVYCGPCQHDRHVKKLEEWGWKPDSEGEIGHAGIE